MSISKYTYSSDVKFEGDFTRIGDFTWTVSDCEEIVGQLPLLLLLPQFSTTISEAKLADSSLSTLSCIDSPIPKLVINLTILQNWVSIRLL
jgi:hypothetical protein